jgi:Ca2+-binding EF-hand superfamily protein
MDRNQDGDVSRREFLGTAESFQKLDQDGDGLIDTKEAAAKKK